MLHIAAVAATDADVAADPAANAATVADVAAVGKSAAKTDATLLHNFCLLSIKPDKTSLKYSLRC